MVVGAKVGAVMAGVRVVAKAAVEKVAAKAVGALVVAKATVAEEVAMAVPVDLVAARGAVMESAVQKVDWAATVVAAKVGVRAAAREVAMEEARAVGVKAGE